MHTSRSKPPAAQLTLTRIGAVGALLLVTGCRSKPINETAAPPLEVTISQVVERTVTDHEEFTGRMDATETVEIRARVRGYLDKVNFTDGQEVKAGDLLFEIDPRTYQAELDNAEGQKAQWLAKRDKAQSDVTRYEGLVPTGAASAQDLDKARAELGEAIAAMQSSDAAIERARLDLEFARITAPIAGQVGRALITKGNLVSAGTGEDALLTTLVSLDPIYVYFDVDERSMLRFRERRRAADPQSAPDEKAADLKLPLLLALSNEKGFPHQGVVDFADNRVDSSTGTISVRGRFDNAKRIFKPGLFARVRVPVSDPSASLLVAESALGTDQGQKYVYVVNAQNAVEKRVVELGALQDDGLQVITSGLKSGEWIVVNGLQRVRPGKPVDPTRSPMPTLGPSAVEPEVSTNASEAAP